MSRKIAINVVHNKWAYEELAESIKDALISFDFDATVSYAGTVTEDFNIFITGKGAPGLDTTNNRVNIFFETDHIDAVLRQRAPIDYSIFTRSLHFFDYTRDLTDQNIYYCPIGYSKHFDTDIPRQDLRPNFHMGRSGNYGHRNQFRGKYDLWTLPPIVGAERDEIIVTSKVNINSRMQTLYFFTPLHAALILCKGKLYMQEELGHDDYNFYKPYLILFDESDFRSKLDYWVFHDKERHDFEQFVHEDIKKNHPFEKYLYAAIGDLLEQYR